MKYEMVKYFKKKVPAQVSKVRMLLPYTKAFISEDTVRYNI